MRSASIGVRGRSGKRDALFAIIGALLTILPAETLAIGPRTLYIPRWYANPILAATFILGIGCIVMAVRSGRRASRDIPGRSWKEGIVWMMIGALVAAFPWILLLLNIVGVDFGPLYPILGNVPIIIGTLISGVACIVKGILVMARKVRMKEIALIIIGFLLIAFPVLLWTNSNYYTGYRKLAPFLYESGLDPNFSCPPGALC